MPRGDRTGPAGMGPMTGRAAGYCAGYDVRGFANPIPGGGYGRGYGRGLGLGFRGGRGGGVGRRWTISYAGDGYGSAVPSAASYGAVPTREQEINALHGQAKYFEDALAEIKKRLGNLETEKPNE
ncbi:MAG: DUF5320 domain-containing protein [Deltaproteobacteria bacterium]|nr:DUF5320 domain-containing protein [Deltaproteobacteria bacterium]